MTTLETPVSKGDFARICNVSPGRVSQWIDEGKIGGAALVGVGRSAKIVVSLAQKQVRARTDSGQAFGNGLKTKLRGPIPSPTPSSSRPTPPDTDAEPIDPDRLTDDALDEQIKRERLEALQRANRKAAEDEAAAQGRYTGTAASKRHMTMMASQTMRIFEGALPEIASALAAAFQVQERDVLLILNEQFRKVREQASQVHARAAQETAALVPDNSDSAEA